MERTPLTLKLRRPKLSDLTTIYKIERESFEHPYPPQVLLSQIILHSDTSVVAVLGSRVIGYSFSAIELKNGKRCLHILNIAVDPKFRGLGIGKTLLDASAEIACKKGVKCMVLEVGVFNERAIKFYEKYGFERIKLLKSYYPWGEDAYLMVKEDIKC